MMHADFPNPFTNAKVVGHSIDTAAYLRQECKRGDVNFVMSSSEIRAFLRCPEKWKDGHKGEGSSSTEWGDLVDCLVTNPQRLESGFSIHPETYDADGEQKKWNGNAKVCEAWIAKQGSKTVVSPRIYQSAKDSVARIMRDADAKEFLDACDRRQVFCVAEYNDAETQITIPVKCLIDLLPNSAHPKFGKSIADFKTGKDAEYVEWQKELFYRGYHIQAAWHFGIYTAAVNEDRCDFRHVIQENQPPFQVACRILTSEFLSLGMSRCLRGLKLYCQCLATGKWPGYDYDINNFNPTDGWAFVGPLPWMIAA